MILLLSIHYEHHYQVTEFMIFLSTLTLAFGFWLLADQWQDTGQCPGMVRLAVGSHCVQNL